MFDFQGRDSGHRDPKIYTTIGALPGHIDPAQPPTKKNPWKSINDGSFVRSLELVMPFELYDATWKQIDERLTTTRYEKVIMKLEEVLQGDFFNEYIKKGNILMLSEGRPEADNVFSLRNGILRLDVDKSTYERTGLQGHPIRSGGRKHVNSRYRIELDLRQPSMVSGRKGFERLVSAAKNVLNSAVIWLFIDVSSPVLDTPEQNEVSVTAIDKFHPTRVECKPSITEQENTRVPPLCPPSIDDDTTLDEWIYETVEWLGLVGLGSPVIREGDTRDSYLSRYALPNGTPDTGMRLCILRWSGFISSKFIMKLMIELTRISRTGSVRDLSALLQWTSLTTILHDIEVTGQLDGYIALLTGQGPQVRHEDVDTTQAPPLPPSIHPPVQPSTGSIGLSAGRHSQTVSATDQDQLQSGLRFYSFFEFQDSR